MPPNVFTNGQEIRQISLRKLHAFLIYFRKQEDGGGGGGGQNDFPLSFKGLMLMYNIAAYV